VPPTSKTRRIVCRPRARLCARLASGLAVVALLLYPDVLGVDRIRGILQVLSAVFVGLALALGAAALFFRITESPREVSVRDYRHWGDPPVIHFDASS
jgi:hypothetical protein